MEERLEANWILVSEGTEYRIEECSNCHKQHTVYRTEASGKYCSECGRKMTKFPDKKE